MSRRIAFLLTVIFIVSVIPAASESVLDYDRTAEMPVPVDTPIPVLDDQPDQVRQAQQCLINLGQLSSRADGLYGPKTVAALRSFQGRNGLVETGHLDEDTFALLTRMTSPDATVQDIQQRLIDLGYMQGKADGYWGERTEGALDAFQQLNGLNEATGADAKTVERLFSDEALPLPAGLQPGDKGDDVAMLQQKLVQYGFLSGRADGAYGKNTASAVKALQQHLIDQGYSVAANGTASPVTLFHLYQPDFTTYVSDVRAGDDGSEAQRVTKRLESLGYMDADDDGVFDDYAAEALRLFQRDARIAASGVADRATIDALFSESAPEAERCVMHDISSGDRGVVVRYAEQALLEAGMTTKLPNGRYDASVEEAVERLNAYLKDADGRSAPLFTNKRSLSVEAVNALLEGVIGAGSGDVSQKREAARVQRRLHSLYYLSKYDIDGRFGGNSVRAIREFQAANGLPETGEADSRTLDLLFSSDAKAKPYPYRVEVSIADQTVTIYCLNANGEYEQARQFICSTGLNNTTPRGIFLDGFPVNRWHYFQKFDCWAQYSFEVEGGIMFHSVIYSGNSESTLRKSSVWALGSPASHGCIRLQVKDAKWMFEHCKRGSLVIVIY